MTLEEVQIEYRVFPVSPFSFIIPLGGSDVGVIHQLRDIIDVLSVFDQRTDECGPSAVGSDSFLFINLLCPFADDIAHGRVTEGF